MEKWLEVGRNAWDEYLCLALDPLHSMGWQTGSLFLILLLSALLIAYWIARATWIFQKPKLSGVKIKGGPHTYKDFLRLHSKTYMALHKRDVQGSAQSDIVKQDLAKDASRYYVVTVVESGKPLPLVTREMHLQFASKRYSVPEGHVQFDGEVLNEIRLNNASQDDDEGGTEIEGTYDIYIRRVQWYDVRHWLTHPNREIRIVLWVTIISTFLPFLIDFLFKRDG